jgi:hypothetical protein
MFRATTSEAYKIHLTDIYKCISYSQETPTFFIRSTSWLMLCGQLISVYSGDRMISQVHSVQKVQGFNVKAVGSHICHYAAQDQEALVTLNVIVVPCTFTHEQKLKTLVKLKAFNWDFAAGRTMLVRID